MAWTKTTYTVYQDDTWNVTLFNFTITEASSTLQDQFTIAWIPVPSNIDKIYYWMLSPITPTWTEITMNTVLPNLWTPQDIRFTYLIPEPETITGFYLDWQEYILWSGNEATWWNITWTLSNQADLNTALNAKANDSDVVKLSGTQTINWQKTFWASPIVPSKTSAATNTWTAIATEAQVYAKANNSEVVKLTGNQTINWTKTFGTSPVVPSKTTAAANTWTAIATEAQVYLKANSADVLIKTNTTSFTPTANYHPATKKYVDDNDTVKSWDSWTTYTIKVSSSAPASWTASNIITIVTN